MTRPHPALLAPPRGSARPAAAQTPPLGSALLATDVAPPLGSARPAADRTRTALAPPRRRRRAAWLAAATVGALALAFGASAAARPPRSASNPLVGLAPASDDREPLVGRVVERLVAGSYTYVAIERDDGRRAWAVTLGRPVAEGARVRVRSFGKRSNFYSARLRRTFPELIFGSVAPAA